jgi:hypothetical protein
MKTVRVVTVMVALSAGLLASEAGAGNVSINIGGPPPIIVAAPPHVVVVPGTPVFYAPGAEHNLFRYGGRYYAMHNGQWFFAPRPGAPWVFLPNEKVPKPVFGLPVGYYKGHARKMDEDDDRRGHGKGGKKGRDH